MNWNERITIAREALGIKKAEFSRRVGVSTATTADWETGVIKMIDGLNLVKAAQVLKVSPEWLMTGEGDDPAVAEFARIYARATDAGREFLKNAVQIAEQMYMQPERRVDDRPVAHDRRRGVTWLAGAPAINKKRKVTQ